MSQALSVAVLYVSHVHDLWRTFETDRVTITDANGEPIKNDVPAQVVPSKNNIMISDTSIPLVPNCTITRKLPSGLVEEFIVLDPGFDQGFAQMGARYVVKVRRK